MRPPTDNRTGIDEFPEGRATKAPTEDTVLDEAGLPPCRFCGGGLALYAPDDRSETRFAANITCHHCGISVQMANHDSDRRTIVAAYLRSSTPTASGELVFGGIALRHFPTLAAVLRQTYDRMIRDSIPTTTQLLEAANALEGAATALEARSGSESGITLEQLQAAHVERQEEWCPDQKPDLSFRGNELGGEAGEAQNVIKKLERERHGWRGSRDTVEHLAEELADVVHTAILCAITAGIDLGPAVVAKFNATSVKNGLSTVLPTPPGAAK